MYALCNTYGIGIGGYDESYRNGWFYFYTAGNEFN